MVDVLHKNLTGADAVHPAAFVQASDPGAVGANLQWIDTSSGPPYTLKLRNAANTGWLIFAAGPTGSTGPTGPTGATGAAGNPGAVTISVTGGQPYICIQDQKPSGTTGGTFTSGAFQTRTLNTLVSNDLNLAVLNTATNQFTLPPGKYRACISCPAFRVDGHQARLQSITGGGTLLYGTAEGSGNGDTVTTRSVVAGAFSLQSSTVLEVQHRALTTSSSFGFGNVAGFTAPYVVYTIAEFWLVDGPPPFFGSSLITALPAMDRLLAQNRVARQDILLPGGNG
jgi:hypothetical protein